MEGPAVSSEHEDSALLTRNFSWFFFLSGAAVHAPSLGLRRPHVRVEGKVAFVLPP